MDDFRSAFDLPREVCYLNAAYMTPQPKSVLEAAIRGAKLRASGWRVTPADFFDEVENLRHSFATIVNCSSENIALVPSVSYGVSTAANNLDLARGETILLLADQFPSNYYPWQRKVDDAQGSLRIVSKSDADDWTTAILNSIEEATTPIRIAALPWHHWSSGEGLDLPVITDQLRGMGTSIVLDLTQTVGAFPVDLSELQADFVAIAGYKWLFCPYGVSFLYVADEFLGGTPLEEGWINREGSNDFSKLADYTARYQPGARRFDVGERASFSNIAAANDALRLLRSWGIECISNELELRNEEIAKVLLDNAFEISGGPTHAPHIQSARLPNANADVGEIARSLTREKVFVSQRVDRLRISPHLYTDRSDLDRFADALHNSIKSLGN